MLIGYDSYIIYRVYLYDEEKIIQIKNLQIFENVKEKAIVILSLIIQLQRLEVTLKVT